MAALLEVIMDGFTGWMGQDETILGTFHPPEVWSLRFLPHLVGMQGAKATYYYSLVHVHVQYNTFDLNRRTFHIEFMVNG